VRIFVGIDLKPTLKGEIIKLQSKIKPHAVKGNWKNEDDFHLTLKFLGDISEEQLTRLFETLEKISGQFKPFSIHINGLDVFGSAVPSPVTGLTPVRVLWLGLDGDLEALNDLYLTIENALCDYGFDKDYRPFAPHVTLGQDIKLAGALETLKAVYEPFSEKIDVDAVTVFNSEVVGGKRVYTPLKSYKCNTEYLS
jgi:2'-5' RNA ligase